MEKDLTFYSAGLRLAGTLYLPDNLRPGDKRPTVLCCHGLRANRRVILPEFARAFTKQGYVAFVFDYRGFGDGDRWMRSSRRLWEYWALRKRVEKDRERRVLTGSSEYVDAYEILIPTPAEEQVYSGSGQIASLKSELPLETAEDMMSYKPEAVVHQIAPRPLLVIGAELDYLTGFEECVNLYEKAREPKHLHILPGISHYETYSKGFDTVMRLSLDLFAHATGNR